MLRLLPYLLVLGAGFAAALVLLRRTGPSASQWEAKYREIYDRYRDLTRQLKGVEERGDIKAAKLRQSLVDIALILRDGSGSAADARAEALRRIDSTLQSDREG